MDKDTIMLNVINQIACRHSCRIVDVDFEKHTISIEGDPENEETCAMELMMVLSEVDDE